MRSVAVIGGGIVGLATARALLQAAPDLELHLLEKESSLAQHQSTHNSGVLHAGLHYAPGSTKARVARAGIRALTAFCAEHGIAAKRLMTDNAFSYVKNRSLRALLARHGIRHLTTKPYRPRTNGKVERFHQTMAREWAYGLAYRSHRQRNQALPHWLDHYNRRRPHSTIGGRPPISRVHNVCRQDS